MGDMSQVIVPKSDQINADDLLSGPMTIKITDVKVSGGQEQPVSMFFAGSSKAYRPCKSMARVLVSAWGADSSKYVGRSMTLYCDPKVKWGGMEVGGIRISHMSDLDAPLTMALTVTRANKKPFTVRPMPSGAKPSTAAPPESGSSPLPPDPAPGGAATPQNGLVSADQAVLLADLCAESGTRPQAALLALKIDSWEKLPAERYPDVRDGFKRKIEERAAK